MTTLINQLNRFEFSNTCGTLIITPINAEIFDETLSSNSAPKLFCQVGLGFGTEASDLASREGKVFKWSQEFKFRRSSEKEINIKLYHKNFFIDPSLLGEGKIYLGRPAVRQEAKTACTLKLRDNEIGKVNLEIRWEPDQVDSSFIQHLTSQLNNSSIPVSSLEAQQYSNQMQLIIEESTVDNVQKVEEAKKPLEELPEKKVIKEPKEQDVKSIFDEGQCTVCYESKKLVVFYKCGHICCCENCAKRFVRNRCPVCRQRVTDYIKVYHV